jgi:hypothetical protein
VESGSGFVAHADRLPPTSPGEKVMQSLGLVASDSLAVERWKVLQSLVLDAASDTVVCTLSGRRFCVKSGM